MAVYSFKSVQIIPISVEKAWDFFSNPANLPLITPTSMSFKIISQHHGEKMYPGQLIEYYVTPLAGIKLYWMTEITHVKEHEYFVDEQRYGPYSMWHHQHFFVPVKDGVEMTDLVHYKNPFGILGRMADPFMVKPKLKMIFDFRRKMIEEIFPTRPA